MLEKFESGESESDFPRQGSEDALASRSDGAKVFKMLQNIKERFYITAHGLKPVFSLVTVPHGYMQIHHV